MDNQLERRIYVAGYDRPAVLRPNCINGVWEDISDADCIAVARHMDPTITADSRLIWQEGTDADGTRYLKASILPKAQTKGC